MRATDRAHWSFRPLERPDPPPVRGVAWCRNAIDRFILARLERSGLAPMPAADRRTLIRRVTFDLTGLPPTPAEIDAFLADPSRDAYETLIDRLLASPAYGERWGQHWLDLARFAESDGFEHDKLRPNAWRYRDWVIEALNRDVPYDEFVRLQIAGDELRPDDVAASVATGFLLCGPDMPDINLAEERRHMLLCDMTATVGSVFLALQIGCAQCHDHKFDPISQADFYRLRAFFEPAEIFDEHAMLSPDERAERARVEAELAPQRKELEARIAAIEDAARRRVRGDAKEADTVVPREELLTALTDEERARHQELSVAYAKLRERALVSAPVGRVVCELSPQPRATHLMIRGDFRRPGPELEPAFPRIANPSGEKLPAPAAGAATSGRRSALAQWLTRPDHPLTTRVIVNRLWQQHFGAGLVRSPSDFGHMGEPPTHPELLDWLATELPRRGWSLKQMHRLLLGSAAYRQASRPADAGWTAAERRNAEESWALGKRTDPENRLLWRMNRQRLDGESIRDAMLAAGNRLSQRRGGPGVLPPLPEELVKTLLIGQWAVSPDPEDHRRRSIYIFVRRNLRYPLFEAFDRPDTLVSCPRRDRSTIAPQALTLLNSEFALESARALAGYALAHAENDADRLELILRRTLGRSPTQDEAERLRGFIASQAHRMRENARDASHLPLPVPSPSSLDPPTAASWTELALAVLNLSEFLYVD